MKNLLIYISPTKSFNNPPQGFRNDATPLVKVQIENSLALGWKVEDILLFTNFNFQYGAVKATVLPDAEFVTWWPEASKINAIVELFEKGLIKDDEVYWFHDLDAFQLCPISESELKLGKADMALTDYDEPSRWNTSSIFFKKSSIDIFYQIKEVMYQRKIDEEKALNVLTDNDKNMRKRIKKINVTYSFAPYSSKPCYSYKMAYRPIKVAHFHPLYYSPNLFKEETDPPIPLIPDRLIKIFRYHGIV